jgi:hypothetical protein
MSNRISTVPATLPPELLTAAHVGSPASNQFAQGHIARTPSVSSTGSGRAPTLPPKIQQSPIRPQETGGSLAAQDWDILPQEKSYFDSVFTSIDKSNKGYIDG